jgi:hypothetical protein
VAGLVVAQLDNLQAALLSIMGIFRIKIAPRINNQRKY